MDTIEIILTPHAIERFRERVRPTLHATAAEDELARLVLFGDIRPFAPAWLAATQRQAAHCYLVVGDIVLPLDPDRRDPSTLVAKTCIARGGISGAARARRNARRAGRRGRAPVAALS